MAWRGRALRQYSWRGGAIPWQRWPWRATGRKSSAVVAVGQGAELAGRGGGAGNEEAPASVGWRASAASRRLACSAGHGVDGHAARANGRK
jgi:hypothetical protein